MAFVQGFPTTQNGSSTSALQNLDGGTLKLNQSTIFTAFQDVPSQVPTEPILGIEFSISAGIGGQSGLNSTTVWSVSINGGDNFSALTATDDNFPEFSTIGTVTLGSPTEQYGLDISQESGINLQTGIILKYNSIAANGTGLSALVLYIDQIIMKVYYAQSVQAIILNQGVIKLSSGKIVL